MRSITNTMDNIPNGFDIVELDPYSSDLEYFDTTDKYTVYFEDDIIGTTNSLAKAAEMAYLFNENYKNKTLDPRINGSTASTTWEFDPVQLAAVIGNIIQPMEYKLPWEVGPGLAFDARSNLIIETVSALGKLEVGEHTQPLIPDILPESGDDFTFTVSKDEFDYNKIINYRDTPLLYVNNLHGTSSLQFDTDHLEAAIALFVALAANNYQNLTHEKTPSVRVVINHVSSF